MKIDMPEPYKVDYLSTFPHKVAIRDNSGELRTVTVTGYKTESGGYNTITLSTWEKVKRFLTPKSRRRSLPVPRPSSVTLLTDDDPDALAKAKLRAGDILGAVETLTGEKL